MSRAIRTRDPGTVAPSTSQRLEQISAWAWELSHTTTGGPVRAAGVFPGGSSWGAAVGAVTLIVIFSSTFLQLYRLEREAARLEQLQRDLEVQNAQLREEIKLLHTPQYIEKLAREQLGLVKPGEIALLLIQSPTDPSPRRPSSNGTDTPSAQDGAGRQPPPTRPGWVGRVWNVLRSLFD